MLLNVKKPLLEDEISSDSSTIQTDQTNNTTPHVISNTNNSDFAIEMVNITKEFPGIKANDNISIAIRRGTIHALVGENGAGKSTLMS
ncbi:MAG: ATP-binding cassette domain-containing protein, partial [Metamycoplasmataceae bacterium]